MVFKKSFYVNDVEVSSSVYLSVQSRLAEKEKKGENVLCQKVGERVNEDLYLIKYSITYGK